jgi:hypothetical protein
MVRSDNLSDFKLICHETASLMLRVTSIKIILLLKENFEFSRNLKKIFVLFNVFMWNR